MLCSLSYWRIPHTRERPSAKGPSELHCATRRSREPLKPVKRHRFVYLGGRATRFGGRRNAEPYTGARRARGQKRKPCLPACGPFASIMTSPDGRIAQRMIKKPRRSNSASPESGLRVRHERAIKFCATSDDVRTHSGGKSHRFVCWRATSSLWVWSPEHCALTHLQRNARVASTPRHEPLRGVYMCGACVHAVNPFFCFSQLVLPSARFFLSCCRSRDRARSQRAQPGKPKSFIMSLCSRLCSSLAGCGRLALSRERETSLHLSCPPMSLSVLCPIKKNRATLRAIQLESAEQTCGPTKALYSSASRCYLACEFASAANVPRRSRDLAMFGSAVLFGEFAHRKP